MENSMAAVEQAAKSENGWTVIGLVKERSDSSQRPCGTVAFVRRPVLEGLPAGTAQYAIQENGNVIFFTGHYDLTRADALTDLTERARI